VQSIPYIHIAILFLCPSVYTNRELMLISLNLIQYMVHSSPFSLLIINSYFNCEKLGSHHAPSVVYLSSLSSYVQKLHSC
jgi:hypothetical protein